MSERERLRQIAHQAMFTTAPIFAAGKLAAYEQETYDTILDRIADAVLAEGFNLAADKE